MAPREDSILSQTDHKRRAKESIRNNAYGASVLSERRATKRNEMSSEEKKVPDKGKKKDKGKDKEAKVEEKKDEPAPIKPLEFGKDPKGFSVRVHVVEARELKSRDAGGTSDPICFVKVHKDKQKTIVLKKTLNAFWDHCFFFNISMVAAEFEACKITLEVYDANTVMRDVMIGAAQVDLTQVYYSPNHEMYKKWVGLMDVSGEQQGPQGYLKFSAVVVPEGEPQPPPHNEDEEEDEEDNADLQSLVMNAPNIALQEYYLDLKVWKGEDLPKTDSGGSCDGFIQVKFGGRTHKTQPKKKTLNPAWNTQLLLPAVVPSLSDRIELQLYDWDAVGENDLISVHYFSFQDIMTNGWGPEWVYFYGAPGADCSEKAELWNKGFKEGTAYRGRVYMQLTAYPTTNPRINTKYLSPMAEQKFEDYIMTVDVYEGNEIVNTSSEVTLEMNIGPFTFPPLKSKTAKKGSVQFYQQTELKFQLPSGINWNDPRLLRSEPDIIVSVFSKGMFGGKKRSGYLRFPLKDFMGFNHTPKWYTVKADEYGYKYDEEEVPGSLMMTFNFGKFSEFPEERPRMVSYEMERYELRAHIYQGRNLPAADSNGLSDPYCKVKMTGVQVRTPTQEETLNPTWYQTIKLDVTLPTPLEYAPDINVLIYDYDKFGGDDLLGRFEFPAKLALDQFQETPEWFPLYLDDPSEKEGEMLCSFQLIPYDRASRVKIPNLKPECKECYFEINAVGLRNLVPYHLMAIQDPVIEFDTGSKENRNSTKNKARVKGSDADLLETVHVSVPLPVREIFAPCINVRVFDQRPLGSVLVASAAIPILPFLPWSKDNLKLKAEEAAKKRAEEEKKAEEERLKRMEEERKKKMMEEEQEDSSNEAHDENAPLSKPAKFDFKSKTFGQFLPNSNKTSSGDVELDVKDIGVDGRTLPEVEETTIQEDKNEDDDAPDDDDDDKEEKLPTVQNELEIELKNDIPFSQYELFRGQTRGLNFLERQMARLKGKTNNRNMVGIFKGRFRVIENEMLKYVEDPINLKDVYKPRNMMIRAYVYRGLDIIPHDDNGFSDPYLLLDTGVEKTTKKDGCLQKKTNNPGFYHCYQMKCVIPGPPLKIQLWDHDDIGSDDSVGETIIDLENRFFCPRWKQMNPKPIEYRNLWTDTSRAVQGKLEMFLEVLTEKEAARLPIKNIAPPPPKPFEMRMVVWETKNVVIEETKVDIFIAAMLDGGERQETDVHWNSNDGYGSFNWRMKFPIMIPYPKPRLKIQLWDKDLLSPNDVKAECVLNLDKYFKRAFKRDQGFEFKEKWLSCFHPDKPGVCQGEVKVDIELLTKDVADIKKNGYGRDEPNQFPVMAKPNRPDDLLNNPLGWVGKGFASMRRKMIMGMITSAIIGIVIMIIYLKIVL